MPDRSNYKVVLIPRARRNLKTVPVGERSRVDNRLQELTVDPRPRGVKKLRQRTDSGLAAWRMRVGKWRVIYIVDDDQKLVVVTDVRRRRENTYQW